MTPTPAEREAPPILPIKFWTDYSTGEPRDWVRWAKRGKATPEETESAVSRLMPRNGRQAPEWVALKPYYEAWKSGEEEPLEGTPLGAWPGASAELVDRLRTFRVRTVQEFLAMADHDRDRIGVPNVRYYVRMAEQFIEAMKVADHARQMMNSNEALDAAREQIEELKAQVAQLMADRPKRGRPPKSRPDTPADDDETEDAA